MTSSIKQAKNTLNDAKDVIILAGAGMSEELGAKHIGRVTKANSISRLSVSTSMRYMKMVV